MFDCINTGYFFSNLSFLFHLKIYHFKKMIKQLSCTKHFCRHVFRIWGELNFLVIPKFLMFENKWILGWVTLTMSKKKYLAFQTSYYPLYPTAINKYKSLDITYLLKKKDDKNRSTIMLISYLVSKIMMLRHSTPLYCRLRLPVW